MKGGQTDAGVKTQQTRRLGPSNAKKHQKTNNACYGRTVVEVTFTTYHGKDHQSV